LFVCFQALAVLPMDHHQLPQKTVENKILGGRCKYGN
jgi:hypothetical protein